MEKTYSQERVMSQLDIHTHLESYLSLNAKLIKLLKETQNILVMLEKAKIINRTPKVLIIKEKTDKLYR